MDGVVVRATQPWSSDLDAGRYQFRYRLLNGSGRYKLKWFVEGETTARGESDELDASNQLGNIWRFVLPEVEVGAPDETEPNGEDQ